MAERSEAPDSKNIPLSLWYSNVCVGSNTTPVECCVQKANTFCSKQFLWELNEEQDEADLHYEKLLTKTDWSNCDIRFLKTRWSSGLRRQTQGNSNETSGTRKCAWVPIPLLSKFLFKKTTFSWKQYSREPNEEQDLTLREGVIGKIPKQLRYTTKGSMAERSKAPDPKKFLWVFDNRMCAWIRILHLTNFAFKKSTFRPVQYLWESNEEQDETDFTWQQKGIENRLKRLR